MFRCGVFGDANPECGTGDSQAESDFQRQYDIFKEKCSSDCADTVRTTRQTLNDALTKCVCDSWFGRAVRRTEARRKINVLDETLREHEQRSKTDAVICCDLKSEMDEFAQYAEQIKRIGSFENRS